MLGSDVYTLEPVILLPCLTQGVKCCRRSLKLKGVLRGVLGYHMVEAELTAVTVSSFCMMKVDIRPAVVMVYVCVW